jgi:hypothetical protein
MAAADATPLISVEDLQRDYLDRFAAYTEEQRTQLLCIGRGMRLAGYANYANWRAEYSKPAALIRYLAERHPAMCQDPKRFITMLERKLAQGADAKLLPFPLKYGPRPKKQQPLVAPPAAAPAPPPQGLNIHVTWGMDRQHGAAARARVEDIFSSSDDEMSVVERPAPYIPAPRPPPPAAAPLLAAAPAPLPVQGPCSLELLGIDPLNFSPRLARWVPIFRQLEQEGKTVLLTDLFLNGYRPRSIEWLLQRLVDAGHVNVTPGHDTDTDLVRLLEIVDWHGAPPPPSLPASSLLAAAHHAGPLVTVQARPPLYLLRQQPVDPVLAAAERKRSRDEAGVRTRPAKKPRLEYKQPDVRQAEADEEHSTCCVCFTNFINAVFLDCQHMYCCLACAEKIFASSSAQSRICPVCRTPMKQKPLGVFHKGGAK